MRNKLVSAGILVVASVLLQPPVAAQSHPSGISNRVLIAVQNPTGAQGSTNTIVPQFSLQIADAINNNFPTGVPALIQGWNTAMPSSLENLSAQGLGVVQNDDGTATLINLATESVTTANVGLYSSVAGTLLTQSLGYVVSANEQTGQLTVIDRNNGGIVTTLNLPGANNISMNPGSSVILVFAEDSSVAYYLRHLNSTDQQTYSNGNWPADAQDCQPYSQPNFCLIGIASSGTSVASYSQANFDHPIKAVTSSDGSSMYIVNGGPGADGTQASVTVLPAGPILFEDGTQSGAIPSIPTKYTLSGTADDAISAGNFIYVAGEQTVPNTTPAVWQTILSVINASTGSITSLNLGNGRVDRMALADDGTLWIGATHCNPTGSAAGGCLSVVNLTNNTIAFTEPWSCLVDKRTPCSAGDHPYNYIYNGGGSGDVTGIAPITGQHKVFYVENGQVHIRQTTSGYQIIANDGVTVSGVAVDVIYMDANSDNDGTSLSTTR